MPELPGPDLEVLVSTASLIMAVEVINISRIHLSNGKMLFQASSSRTLLPNMAAISKIYLLSTVNVAVTKGENRAEKSLYCTVGFKTW